MFSVAKLRRKPKHFHSFCGLSPEQFDQLLAEVVPVYEAQELAQKSRSGRKRVIGGGRKFKLAIAERLLMTLMYYRLYVSYILLGYLFGLDDSNAGNEVRRRMQPVLLEVLPIPMQKELFAPQLTGRKDSGTKPKRIQSLEELLKLHPQIKEVLIDATEQEVPRPSDKLKRKTRYSGKHKKHTLKTQVTGSKNLILHVSKSVDGSVSDLTLLRASGVMYQIPQEVKARLDRGYEGIEEEYPGIHIEKPIRNQRNHHLTALGKAWNQIMSRCRVPIEHLLAKLEKFKLLSGEFRGHLSRYDDSFAVIAGLVNFKTLGRLAW
jgi:hypothetical protein